jgi:hypothetical protein
MNCEGRFGTGCGALLSAESNDEEIINKIFFAFDLLGRLSDR